MNEIAEEARKFINEQKTKIMQVGVNNIIEQIKIRSDEFQNVKLSNTLESRLWIMGTEIWK